MGSLYPVAVILVIALVAAAGARHALRASRERRARKALQGRLQQLGFELDSASLYSERMQHPSLGMSVRFMSGTLYFEGSSGEASQHWALTLRGISARQNAQRGEFAEVFELTGNVAVATRVVRDAARDAFMRLGGELWTQNWANLRCADGTLSWRFELPHELRGADGIGDVVAQCIGCSMVFLEAIAAHTADGPAPAQTATPGELLEVLMEEPELGWASWSMRELLVLHARSDEAARALEWLRTERALEWRAEIAGYVLEPEEYAFHEQSLEAHPNLFFVQRLAVVSRAPLDIARPLARALVERVPRQELFDAIFVDRFQHSRGLKFRPELDERLERWAGAGGRRLYARMLDAWQHKGVRGDEWYALWAPLWRNDFYFGSSANGHMFVGAIEGFMGHADPDFFWPLVATWPPERRWAAFLTLADEDLAQVLPVYFDPIDDAHLEVLEYAIANWRDISDARMHAIVDFAAQTQQARLMDDLSELTDAAGIDQALSAKIERAFLLFRDGAGREHVGALQLAEDPATTGGLTVHEPTEGGLSMSPDEEDP